MRMKIPFIKRQIRRDNSRKLRDSYLLLLFLPFVLGFFLYFAIHSVVENQITTKGELTVQDFQTRVSSILKEVEIVTEAIVHDKDFRVNTNVDVVTTKSSDFVITSIGANRDQSEYIDKIYVIDEKQSKIYSNDGAVHSLDSLDSILKNNNLAGLDYASMEGWSGTLYNDYSPPIFIRDILSEDNQERIGSILVLLRRTDLLRLLSMADAECISLFNERCSIYYGIDENTAPDWYDSKAVSGMLGKRVKCIYAKDDNFAYMVAISVDKYYAPIRMIFYFFAVYILLILGLGIWNLWRIEKKRRKRVDSVLSTLPKEIKAGNTDEEIMSAVSEALERYRENDKSIQERDRAYTMQHILLGHYGQITAELLKKAGIPDSENGCYVVTLFLDEGVRQRTEMPEEVEVQDVADVIFHSVLKQLAGDRAGVASVEMYPNYSIIVCPKEGMDAKQTVLDILSEFIALLENRYGFIVRAMVSQRITNLPVQLRDAYKSTVQLYNFVCTIDSDKKIVLREDMDNAQGGLLNGDYLKQIQILTNTLIAEKYDVIATMTDSILNDYVTPLRKEYQLGQRRLNNIANLLMESIRVSNIPGLDKDDLIERIQLSVRSVSSLKAAVNEVFEQIAESQKALPEESDPVSAACTYIKENMSDSNLTVPLICENAGVSVQHLSRLFRQKKDTTVMEYLNGCRIHRAKQLLEDRSLTVAYIGKAVGYNSTETFTRNFRRREGLTPTEYRNLHYQV